jgi:hypothetical protein
MLNPWFSFSLDTAQLVFKLTRLMAGGTLYPTGSSRMLEASAAPIAEVPAPVAEEQEGPAAVAFANHRCRKSTTERHVQKKPAKGRARQAPKPTAPKRTTRKRAAAASLVRPKAIRRSALQRK